MVSPEALIFQASPVFTAVAVLVHFIVPMPRSCASTARSWVQVLSSLHLGLSCGVTVTVLATSAVSTSSSRLANVVGLSVSAPAASGFPSGAQAVTQASANCLITAPDACCSSLPDFPPPDLLSEQPAVISRLLKQTIAVVRFTFSTLARRRMDTGHSLRRVAARPRGRNYSTRSTTTPAPAQELAPEQPRINGKTQRESPSRGPAGIWNRGQGRRTRRILLPCDPPCSAQPADSRYRRGLRARARSSLAGADRRDAHCRHQRLVDLAQRPRPVPPGRVRRLRGRARLPARRPDRPALAATHEPVRRRLRPEPRRRRRSVPPPRLDDERANRLVRRRLPGCCTTGPKHNPPVGTETASHHGWYISQTRTSAPAGPAVSRPPESVSRTASAVPSSPAPSRSAVPVATNRCRYAAAGSSTL